MAARTYSIPSVLPILTLPLNQVLYPGLVLSIQIVRKDSIVLLQSVLRDAEDTAGNKTLIIGCGAVRAGDDGAGARGTLVSKSPTNGLATPPASDDDVKGEAFTVVGVPSDSTKGGAPSHGEVFEYATAARIVRLERLSTGGFLAVVEGLSRIRLVSFTPCPSYIEAHIELIPALPLPPSPESDALVESLHTLSSALLTTIAEAAPLPPLLARRLKSFVAALSLTTAPPLVDSLLASLPVSATGVSFLDKLVILATHEPTQRVKNGLAILDRVQEGFKLKKQIGDKVDATLSRRQREFLLAQLQAITTELEALAAKDGAAGTTGILGPRRPARSSKHPQPAPAGEEEDDDDDMAELEKKVKEKVWTEESRKVAFKELKRLKKSPPQGSEHGVIRNYLDWLIALPWTETTPLPLSKDFIAAAKEKLDRDHYGLEKIKKRLLEWLAVLRLRQEQWDYDQEALSLSVPSLVPSDSTAVVLRDPATPPAPTPAPARRPVDKAPILLLHGPPGTGKTSIARSLAEAMGRKFYRISLGGVRDEAEIRGHRRTYVAALPGALAMALKKTGVMNPVILLDEIDKLGKSSTQGDPSAALLEVLDPEQNWCFQDHYLGIPMDLSGVLFIATANSLDTISDPLYDRMEVIELSGYVHEEKLHIARQYLIPKQLTANVLPPALLSMTDEVLLHLVTSYTREAGVRSLEREIAAVCRAKAVEYAQARDRAEEGGDGRNGDVEKWGYRKEVTKEDLDVILGGVRYEVEDMEKEGLVGVSTGLAYQGSGNGGILHIESTSMPGTGGFKLTGQLGEVITESANLALAWVKSHSYELGISPSRTEDIFKHIDIHIHLPSGSVKKDGPSAGVAMVCALVSLLRDMPILGRLAMTGEITLRGNVTPVGGIKEKVLGAHRSGIRTLILPFKNEKDVNADLPPSIKSDLTFIFVRSIWEALDGAFGPRLMAGIGGRRTGGELFQSHL